VVVCMYYLSPSESPVNTNDDDLTRVESNLRLVSCMFPTFFLSHFLNPGMGF